MRGRTLDGAPVNNTPSTAAKMSAIARGAWVEGMISGIAPATSRIAAIYSSLA
jgi:hypothetical protein